MRKIKGLFLCLGLIIAEGMQLQARHYYVVRESSDFEQKIDRFLTYVVCGAVALSVGVYLCGRESNASVVKNVNQLYESVDFLCQHNLATFDSLIQKDNAFGDCSDVFFTLKQCVENRYGSWIKPWDWSQDMQQAYDKIRLITVLYGYIPLLQKAEALTGENVLQFARETFCYMNQYPCLLCFNNLDQDIQFVHANLKTIDTRLVPLLKEILPILEKSRKLLRIEKEYLDEARAKTGHGLQEAQLLATLCRR